MRYPAIVTREGRRSLVAFPDCPGCQTFAERGEDVAAVAREALQGWLEAHLARSEAPHAPGRARRLRPGERLLWVPVGANLAAKVILRRARIDAGLTQAQLAVRAGVSQPAIAKLESPDVELKLATLERALRALDLGLEIATRKSA